MRYVTVGEVVDLHRRLLQATGGTSGIRDFGALESAVAQPKATFGGVDLYPTLVMVSWRNGISADQLSGASGITLFSSIGRELAGPRRSA